MRFLIVSIALLSTACGMTTYERGLHCDRVAEEQIIKLGLDTPALRVALLKGCMRVDHF